MRLALKSVHRRVFILLAVSLTLIVTGCGSSEPRLNLVLISIDTLRPDRLGCYGYDRDTSPAMDQLAAEGTLFNDVSSVSPWTLPAHATLMTGLYPNEHGVKDNVFRLSDDHPTLATRLADRGYQTMGVVNSYHLTRRYNLSQGFEKYGYVSEFTDPTSENRVLANSADQIVRYAKDLIAQRDERPFFMFLHFYDVHSDYTPDAKYREMFVRPYEGNINGLTRQLVKIRRKERQLNEDDSRHLSDLYDAEIRQLDDQLADLFRHLEESGLKDNTVLVVTSDHGEEFMEHGSILHGRTYYQEVIAIPLILAGPGVPRGARVSSPISLMDLPPTILGLLDQPASKDFGGMDLRELWKNGPEPGSRFLFAEADYGNAELDIRRMVRHGQYKLYYDRLSGEKELFDLLADPGEQNDLSALQTQKLESLMIQLEDFMSRERKGEMIDEPNEEELERLQALGYAQ